MPFVKLDTGILNSTLWIEREQRELFITALLMAEPAEFQQPVRQIEIGALRFTDFYAPPGWYGFVPAASVGIIRRAGVDQEVGMEALRKLGEPELESRSKDFEGRRMIRIDGGFLILNYMKYRDKDHTAALRQQRLRDRRKALLGVTVTRDVEEVTRDEAVTARNITHAEADTDAEVVQKPSRAKARAAKNGPTKTALADARHAEFKEAIRVYWKTKNEIDMPWGPAEGKQLSMWLREAPHITLEQFRGFLRNRFRSDVNHGERPCQWIRWITSYGPGPTDRFKNTAGGENGTSQQGTAKQSVTSQRLHATRLAIAKEGVRRGWITPPGASGEDSEAVSGSGQRGDDTGDDGGFRTIDGETWTGKS